MSKNDDENSVSLIYDISKDALSIQREQKKNLETKAQILIGFAGAMLGLLMGGREGLLTMPQTSQIILLCSIIFFFVSITFATIVLWVRTHEKGPRPDTIAEDFLNETEINTKFQVISQMNYAWVNNSKKYERIAKFLQAAFTTQALAFILLGISLFFSVIFTLP